MRTLYIDVYFLINLAVDTIAIYFGCKLVHIRTTKRRLLLSSLLGALMATVAVLLPEYFIIKVIFILLGPIFISLLAPKEAGVYRRLKLSFAFIVFSALLGGFVNLVWQLLDGFLGDYKATLTGASVNRKLLLMACTVLISLGVIKLLVAFFSADSSARIVEINIKFLGRSVSMDGLIDSGNLAVDPMDMQPVVLIKKSRAVGIFPEELLELRDPDLLTAEVRRRIRLIPITLLGKTRLLVAVKPDRLEITLGKNKEQITATVAIDREEGSFGGCDALIPASLIDNA